jgi:hypothetical protein
LLSDGEDKMQEKLKQIIQNTGAHLGHWVKRRRLVIGMTQGQVCVMVLQGWSESRIAAQYEQAIDAGVSESSTQWSPHVQTLQTILNTHGLQNLPCAVVLSEQWVRWAAVPWMAEGMSSDEMSAQELGALVQLSFTQLYTDTQDWVSVTDRPRYGQSQLAAAIPKALLEKLRSVLTSRGLRLSACHSALALAWNRAQRSDDHEQRWMPHVRADQAQLFVTLDGQTLTLLGKSKPDMSVIRSVQVATQPVLPVQVIEREIVLQQLQRPKVTVLSLNRLPADLDVPEHWQIRDATNAQSRNLQDKNTQALGVSGVTPVGMSSACALCHLLSPIKRDKPKRKLEQWADDFAFKRSKALDIDFARHNAQPIWSTRQLFVMSVLSAVLLLTNYVYLDVQVGSVQSQLDEAKGQQTARKGKRGASDGDERQNAELANARQIVASLNRPWERLFVAIEAATNSDVTLLDITPNPQGGDLHVSGDARNFKSVLAFVQALKEQGSATQDLSQVYLASHQIQEQDPLRTIRFEVNASWHPKDAPLSDTGVNSPKATNTNTDIVGLGGVDAQQTVAHLEGSR